MSADIYLGQISPEDAGLEEVKGGAFPMHKPRVSADKDEINLCKGCNTMKHLNADGLCGRCVSADKNLREQIIEICRYSRPDSFSYYHDRAGDVVDDRIDALMELFTQHDAALLQKLMEALPQETWSSGSDDLDQAFDEGYNIALTEVLEAIQSIFGEEA